VLNCLFTDQKILYVLTVKRIKSTKNPLQLHSIEPKTHGTASYLGDRIVDIDGRERQFALLEEFVKSMDSGGSFFRDTLDPSGQLRIFVQDETSQITAIVQDHVQWGTIGPEDCLLNAPIIFLFRFSFPRVYCHSGDSNGGCSVVLG